MEEQLYRSPDGTKLHGISFRKDGSRAAVLFFGGNGFHIRNEALFRARAFADVGLDSYFVDYRGYGESEGTPGISALKSDALAIYDSLIASGKVRPEALIVHGHSMGTFVATYVATQRPVAALVLESPVTSVDEWVSRRTPGLVNLLLHVRADPVAAKESNVERIRQVNAPLLVIVGSNDESTPPDMARRVFAAASLRADRNELYVLAGSDHNDVPSNPGFRPAFQHFVNSVLVTTPKP